GEDAAIRGRMAELAEQRREKQPLQYPSAGSTFKRPTGYFAGKLVQDAGLKGKTIGGAQVSEKHSGFLINIGNATAKDILDLITFCQKEVKDQFGVVLETEVKIVGEE
ncbi:MAG: UDP-N-acetylenolpyruvoylglucosamine reductase, partial [Anaerotignum sp.]|nr:UDP-N-acetylenolpyruvoylglucosamine reductase [Anaerotignum sp.]